MSLVKKNGSISIADNMRDDAFNCVNDSDSFSTDTMMGNSFETINKNKSSRSSFCINVKVIDKVVCVPIPDNKCSVGWLANQAAQVYQDLVGITPHLLLTTRYGALLSETDPIKGLLVNNETIISSVESWYDPSPGECYVDLCFRRGLEPIPSVLERFSIFEESCEIDFSNCTISLPQLTVIFSSLRHFHFLQSLDISGTEIADKVACEIIACFPSFVFLKCLNMSCCYLTSNTLKNVSQYLIQQSSAETKLPHLKILNFSSNNIHNSDSSLYVNVILQHCSLHNLILHSCNLIPSFFEDKQLCQTIQRSTLEELSIAGNGLGTQSIINLLSCLPKNCLRKLDLYHTINKDNRCMEQIGDFLSSFLPQLEEINLQDCHLKDEDLYLLIKNAFYCPKLKSCKISSNDLSCIGILHFLKAILITNKALTSISCAGTCTWDMTSVIFLIRILNYSSSVNYLLLDNVPESCRAQLVQFWKRRWGNKAFWFSRRFFKLSVL